MSVYWGWCTEPDRVDAWKVFVELKQVFTQPKSTAKTLTAEELVRSRSEDSLLPQRVGCNAETQLPLGVVTGGSHPSSRPPPPSLVLILKPNRCSERRRRAICTAGLLLSQTPGRRKLKGMGESRVANGTGERR